MAFSFEHRKSGRGLSVLGLLLEYEKPCLHVQFQLFSTRGSKAGLTALHATAKTSQPWACTCPTKRQAGAVCEVRVPCESKLIPSVHEQGKIFPSPTRHCTPDRPLQHGGVSAWGWGCAGRAW
eukprot:1146367-Pelagomonas_calceolata.AAC.2